MRNLKKVLALSLVFALSFVMLAGAAPQFTDSADIKAIDAVNLLASLGIINGKPDGSFDPTGTFTRGEMAKMIYVIMNRGTEERGDYYAGLPTKFSDIAGHWAEGYIKYCQSVGIISGTSATTFEPDAAVTGTQVAKMLLVALGYKPEVEGLVGSNWELKTMALATENNLFGGYDDVRTAPSQRQYAAQIFSNALETNTVYYNSQISSSAISNATGEKAVTLGQKYLDLQSKVGVLVSDKSTALDSTSNTDNSISIISKSTSTGVESREQVTFTKVKDDFSGLIGQEVKVLYGKTQDKVYGVFATSNNKVLTVPLNAVERDGDSIKIDSKSYGLDKGSNIYTDSSKDASFVVSTDEVAKAATSTYFDEEANKNSINTITLIDNNGSGRFNVGVVKRVGLGEISFVGNDTVTVNSKVQDARILKSPNQKVSDIAIYDGFAKDDLVFYSHNYGLDKDEITKAKVVSTKVSGTRTNEWLIDGEWVKAATGFTAPSGIASGDSVDVVTIGNLLVFMTKTSGAASIKDVASVIKVGEITGGVSSTKIEAQLMLADGTKKTVIINKVDDGTATKTLVEATIGKLVTYGVNNDSSYDIKNLSSTNQAGYDTIVNDRQQGLVIGSPSKVGNTTASYEFADDAVVFLYHTESADGAMTTDPNNNITVITGKQAKNLLGSQILTSNGGYATYKKDGFEKAQLAILATSSASGGGYDKVNDKFTVTTNGSSYGYLTADSYRTTENGVSYTNYPIWDGSADVTVKEEASNFTQLKAGLVVAFDRVSGDLVKNVALPDNFYVGAIQGYDSGSTIQFTKPAGSTQKISNDTIVMNASTKDKKGVPGNSISRANDIQGNGQLTENAMYILSGGEVIFLLVDVNNKIEGFTTTLTGSVTEDQVAKALESYTHVTVSGALTVDKEMKVAPGQTLDVQGALTVGTAGKLYNYGTVKAQAVTINGMVLAASSDFLTSTGAITVKSAGTLRLEKVGAVQTAGLNVETGGFVKMATTTGKIISTVAISNSGSIQGYAGSEISAPGTYTAGTGATSSEFVYRNSSDNSVTGSAFTGEL